MNYKHSSKEHKTCDADIDCAKCKAKHPKAKEILLECGEGNGSRTFRSSEDSPFQLAHVRLNKGNLKISEVVIKFSSLVKIEIEGTRTVRLQYELFKSCDGKLPLSLGSWIFEKNTESLISFTSIEESFSFTFCECKTLKDCCDYFVTVTPVEIDGGPVTITVSNGRIAALTQPLCDELKNKEKKASKGRRGLELDKILLSCGKGTSAGQSVLSNFSLDQPPTNVAQVIIDTTRLSQPKVLIEFSGIIGTYNQNFRNLVLQFELFRICGDSKPISCGIWTFEETVGTDSGIEGIQEQKPFSFVFCESMNVSKCCTYFVKVIPLQVVPFFSLSTWEICNVQINAYAQSSRGDELKNSTYKTPADKDVCDLSNKVHPKPQKILLECGIGNGSRTFNLSPSDTSFQLANVAIDTSCLCKPVVNIEFSSTVSFEAETLIPLQAGQLRYELFRTCDGGPPISIGVWIVNRFPLLIRTSTETFNFTYCDCITCPGCCDYFVTATPIRLYDQPPTINTTITVGNGSIVALAQEG